MSSCKRKIPSSVDITCDYCDNGPVNHPLKDIFIYGFYHPRLDSKGREEYDDGYIQRCRSAFIPTIPENQISDYYYDGRNNFMVDEAFVYCESCYRQINIILKDNIENQQVVATAQRHRKMLHAKKRRDEDRNNSIDALSRGIDDVSTQFDESKDEIKESIEDLTDKVKQSKKRAKQDTADIVEVLREIKTELSTIRQISSRM
jgi:hypothetical protein